MREVTKREDKRKENAYDEWSNEVEAMFRPAETHQEDILERVGSVDTANEQASLESRQISPTDELASLEASSREFFDMLKEQVVREDEQLTLPVLDVPESTETAAPAMPTAEHRRLSPAWLVAAVVLGFVIGFLMPRGDSLTASHNPSAFATDSSICCRSLADGDVNTSLLVSL